MVSSGVPVKTLVPKWGWIVRFHIGQRRKLSIPYKGVEISLVDVFKIVRLMTIRNGPNWTISVSGRRYGTFFLDK